METAIRFSQNATHSDQHFLYVDVTGRTLQLSRVTNKRNGVVQFESIGPPVKTPPFRAFDWSPRNESLVVVGQSSGEATLLRIEEGTSDSISFQVRNQRLCNAVALSTQNLLAAGLDRVRTDVCLNIWDFQQRISSPVSSGLSSTKSYSEPLYKLANSEPITSLKFFQNDPQLLVAGVKGQFVRLYDLREPSSTGALSFATRCVHNLAIDGQDENYFASCYPTNDPAICVWDRRMVAHLNTGSVPFASHSSETRPPEVSLELKSPIDSPGTIWSLRFSRTQRGCLGVLSSTGHFKVYSINTEYLSQRDRVERANKWGSDWEMKRPQQISLDRSWDIERAYYTPGKAREEKLRIVSFDFTTSKRRDAQPEVIALTGDGGIKVLSLEQSPEGASFSSLGFILKGRALKKPSITAQKHEMNNQVNIGKAVDTIRRSVEAQNPKKQSFKQARQNKVASIMSVTSFANQAWNSDLGYFEKGVPLGDILTLLSMYQWRCEAGYLFSAGRNITIASDSPWLQSFWAWVDRATRISKSGNMVQDNLDLSFLGVHALWMEDVPYKTRAIGPSSNKISKIIEALVRRLKVTAGKICSTEYLANRQLCLHVSALAWTYEELEGLVKRLVSKNQHTKAAAIALFADERKLAYNALRQNSATQSHRMLAMAIAGASKRSAKHERTKDEDIDDDWSDTITALADELVDPYARAILTLVRSGDWEAVIQERSLPLKYRVGIALRWLSDSALTVYISSATKDAIADGDIEGVVLTGTGTNASLELMTNYVRGFGDLQTAVLALSMTVPRFIDEAPLVRRFEQWRGVFRQQMNSWGLKYDRVRFDIGAQKFAVDANGRKLLEAAKPQVAVVCGYCSQSVAQFDAQADGEDSGSTQPTAKHPLTSEKAAAIGTVCPKCGRHLPRCGVCDLWLGTPDPSHMSWYAQAAHGTVDLSASIAGSVNTTIGPSVAPRSIASSMPKSVGGKPAADAGLGHDTQAPAEAQVEWEEMMKKFTVFCIKCSHGFHANHARQWFGGYSGREGHKVCPVSSCQCVCDA